MQPPPPEVIILLPLKLYAERVPKVPAYLPLNLLPKASAESSTRVIFQSLHIYLF